MSKTIVDMPKVTQMLDNGWQVAIWKNELGSYTARGAHKSVSVWHRAKQGKMQEMLKAGWSKEEAEDLTDSDFCNEGEIDTDDFTPEKALTRLAYKVHGEVI